MVGALVEEPLEEPPLAVVPGMPATENAPVDEEGVEELVEEDEGAPVRSRKKQHGDLLERARQG